MLKIVIANMYTYTNNIVLTSTQSQGLQTTFNKVIQLTKISDLKNEERKDKKVAFRKDNEVANKDYI